MMSQLTPYLRYPGGCPAFFTDLHLHFSRWLRLVALVPLVHASVNGISYDDLCSHLLGVFPSSNPSNVLAVSVERIRSAVSEMLLEEPFFVCSFSDSKSSLSTSRWVYEPSLDYDPSRISFAFSILRCINLSPGWAVWDLLSGLTSVALFPALSISESNSPESGRQQEPPSGYRVRGHSSPHSASTPVVRVLVSSATIPHASVGPDRPEKLNPPPSSRLRSLITPDPPQPHVPLNPPLDSLLVMVGSEVLQENHLDTAYVSHHLSRPYEVPPRHCNTPALSGTNSYSVEDLASDLATSAQYKGCTSDLSVHLGQLPSPFSTGRSNHSGSPYAKIPLFLPSQTPNRDPSPPDILSPQPSSLTPEARSSSKASPMRSRSKLYNNHPRSDLSHTSALQNVDTEVHLNAEEGISSVDSRSPSSTCVMASKLPFSLEWPDRFGTNACPQTPSVELNHGPSRYQSTSYSNLLEERREVSGSGCNTHEAIRLGVPPALRDLGPSETPVPKRARHPITPVLATILDAPFSTPFARSRKTRTPSPLTPFNFSNHEGSSGAGEGQTCFNPSDINPRVPRPGRSSCALMSPPSNAPQSDPGQNASLYGTSRPSVIVYKVAMGPNLARSKDVIRVSYGEGHRKRNSIKHLGHGSKTRDLGRHASPLKEHDNPRRDGAAKHPGRRLLRSRLCFGERRGSSAGPQGADTKVSGEAQSAERVEGDMAWDFGAGSQTRTRRVDVDRSRVRVGGLTSVRMIPRTAVDCEIGPGVTRLATVM